MRKSTDWYRRTVLRAIATGTVAGAAGCLGGDEDTPSTEGEAEDTDDGTSDQSVAQGGTLRIPTTRSFESINGLMASSGSEQMLNGFYNAYLVQLNPDLTISPELATEWESNEDKTQWTFHLRDDFTFHHNGNSVLAEDVVATINTIFAEDSEAAGKSNLGPVDNAEVVNDTTVQLNLTQPDFITEARWGITWAPIYPKDVVENRWDEMSTTDFGAGPFKVDNFSPGNEVAMSAYEDFPVTDDEGTKLPYMDGVTVSVTPDSSTMITEFLNQGTDLIRAVPFGQFSRLENADGVETQTTEVASFPVIQMRATEAPFDDNRVRTAFKLAVDREAIIASALNGYGTIGNDHPVGAAYLGHSELPEQRSQDMGRAEELLQEAGYGEGGESIDLEFKAPNNPQYVLDTTVLAAENFNQLSNVNVEVVQQSYDTWINETWLNSRFYTSWYGQEVRSALQLEITWHSEGAWNEANWSDDEFDTALENAIAAQSEEEYKSEIKTCEQILYERGPSIVPAFRPILSGHWDYVHGYEPARNESYVIADEMWIEDEAPTK